MKLLKVLLLSLFVLLLIVGGAIFWLLREIRSPVSHARNSEYITIPRGSSPDEITKHLASLGVIRRAWPLQIYMRFQGSASRLKAGDYRFPSPISPLAVLSKLEAGQQRLEHFTIIEGWTRWDVAAALSRLPELDTSEQDALLELMNNTNLIRDLDPLANNLEGYLYPDTYSFPPSTSAEEIIATMVKRFRQVWIQEQAGKATWQNRSVREIVTIASLIETEAKLKEERPLIASVIYNRLNIEMPLGIDSTVIYASKLAGKWKNDGKVYQSDIDRVSPYNTRRVGGLPPGPVASPAARSLAAALNPADTDYLFYVRNPSRDDGAHNFYSNDSEFQNGVKALREWERNRDARQR